MSDKALLCGAGFTSPANTTEYIDRKTVCLDDFNVDAMRCLVHDFYCEKKYHTLDSLPAA